MPNYHEPVTSGLESQLSGVVTDISTLSADVAAIQTTVSGSGVDLSTVQDALLGSGNTIIGIPNVNTGNRVQGHKCTTSATETTLFITNTAGFAFVQAYGDASLGSSAIVRVYAGSIATENLVAYALIPAGTSQVVACSPAYAQSGFIVTAQADGTNPVCVSFSYYSPEPVSSTEYQTGDDTHIYAGGPTTNHGGETFWYVGGGSAANAYRTLLKFDLSGIPAGSLVSSANLQLTVQAVSGSNLTDFQIRRCLRDFVEAEATWQIYSTGNSWDADGGTEGVDYSATIEYNGTITATAGQTVTIDLTTLVKQWADGTYANQGVFILDAVPGVSVYRTFYSFETGTPANRPKLTVSLV